MPLSLSSGLLPVSWACLLPDGLFHLLRLKGIVAMPASLRFGPGMCYVRTRDLHSHLIHHLVFWVEARAVGFLEFLSADSF